MDGMVLQTLLGKLKQQSAAMAAATASLSRLAAGAPTAAASGAPRGVRSAATGAAAGGMSAILAGEQQQYAPPPLRASHLASASYHSAAGCAHPGLAPQRLINLAAAAAAPPPSHLLSSGAASTPPCASLCSVGTARLQLPVGRRRLVTAAAAEDAAEHECSVHYDGSDAVGVGSLFEFERGQQYYVGRAIKTLAQGWQVEAESGVIYSVKHPDIKFVLPGGPGASPEALRDLAAAAQSLAGQEGLLELAWELAADSGPLPELTAPHMADLLFNSTSAAACAAALRLLRADRLYFKQVGRSPPKFAPRSRADVESLQAAAQQQQEAATEWARFAGDVAAAQAAPRASKPGEDAWRAGPHATRLAAVAALALGDVLPSSEEYRLACKTLADLGKTPAAQDAAELLQSIGWWPPHLQLGLVQAGVSDAFTPELEDAAQQLLASPPPDPDAGRRRDFTGSAHSVVTIDDASTTEIDDGLSLERLADGSIKVWVHVADPSRWVAPGSALAREACARSKSMYLPTGVVPMFPKCLAEGPFSLRQGLPTEAVSVGARLSPGGALLADTVEVVPSRVAPARRLTYVDVDEMLVECDAEQEPDLFALQELAERRRRYRAACGATEIAMPESNVRVERAHEEQPTVEIEAEDQYGSAARQMVAEMMILAGEAVGALGGTLKVPLPYRGQAEPMLPGAAELAVVPPGPCQAVMLRQRMTRSQTLTHAPLRHAGLGLDAYVQFTSPIRRYGDLLAHWQLKAALRGEAPPQSADQLGDEMEAVATTMQRLTKLEREVESYWVAEYFRQATAEDPRSAWGATFLCWLKQEVGLARVLVNGLGLETVVKVDHAVQPGELVFVKVGHTDVRSGMWRLAVIHQAQAQASNLVNAHAFYK